MIYLPPPQPVLNKDIRISGDVEIHPTASLAPGVILQAAPERRIVIGADACVGMGAIINACQGSIEIGNGAILGSGVLIIGASKIGNNACIGTSSTIFQENVEAMKVIEPGSIIGDLSRKVSLSENQKQSNSQKYNNNSHGVNGYKPKTQPNQTISQDFWQDSPSASSTQEENRAETSVELVAKPNKVPVVGQVYVNELLVTLFPHSKGLNSNSGNSS
ncbi:LbetaH domain-containing protein [Pleurocapsa sp. FMAR1]|uniref:hypothetical protein n=1 Tax=Pleurocapsa sp. FMAR1 TaxID=3040204 RepID=UPI0029C77DEB|nr:hypothetical protein [Pleurocapsa sp. FMAR1]